MEPLLRRGFWQVMQLRAHRTLLGSDDPSFLYLHLATDEIQLHNVGDLRTNLVGR